MKVYRIAAIPGDGIGKEVVPAGQKVLEHHIGTTDEVDQKLPSSRVRDVDRNAFLVSIHRKEVGAFTFAVERRSPASRFVTCAGPFHFDDISAQVAQNHRTYRPGEHSAQIQYF